MSNLYRIKISYQEALNNDCNPSAIFGKFLMEAFTQYPTSLEEIHYDKTKRQLKLVFVEHYNKDMFRLLLNQYFVYTGYYFKLSLGGL